MGRGKLGKGGTSPRKKAILLVASKAEIVPTVMTLRVYLCVTILSHLLLNNILSTKLAIPAGFGLGSKAPQLTQSALMHSSVEIICNPTGEPKPVVRWRFGAAYLQSKGRFHISSNGNLRITNVTKSDSGEYICEASNTLGKASRTGFVNVVGML